MNEIKELIKKAKKEEKTNPEFLYQLGLRFKNGDGVKADIFKADKYFEKASKLGHLEASVESALFWWKTIKNYYFTEKFLSKAIALGSEEAKELLAQMKEEEAEKKAAKGKVDSDNLIHCTNNSDTELYETPKFKDDADTKFTKHHTLICCPACKGKITLTSHSTVGEMTKEYITIYDPDTCFERRSDPYLKPTDEGVTFTQSYECENCKMAFDKITNTRYVEKEKEETLREALTMTGGGTEWWKIMKISYSADQTKVGKDVLRILKKSEGTLERKGF